MNKRGQFFLVAAIIIVVIIIGLTTVYTQTRTSVEDETPEKLSQEISFEGTRVIDYGVFSEQNASAIQEYLDALGEAYLGSNPDMRIILIYFDEENPGDSSATSYQQGSAGSVGLSESFGEYGIIPTQTSSPLDLVRTDTGVKFNVDGTEYEAETTTGKNVIVVAITESGNEEFVSIDPSREA